jgi:flagellin-like hook-associated protein FlgL
LQELITGIRTALSGAADTDYDTVKRGQDLVKKSVKSLAALAAKTNLDITTVDSVNNQHSQLKIFWRQSLAEDIETDVTEATTELQLNSTILQASYQAFAKISQLKLTDYLN